MVRKRNPTSATNIVADVEIHSASILNTRPKITIALTEINIVSPAGAAILSTLDRKFPLILLVFGSSASMNDGTPIVNALIKVSCLGFNGYESTLIIENMARRIENIFFVR